jgi:hypothetical protein
VSNAATADFYALEDLLEPAEIEVRDRVRDFCEREVTPIINDFWERAEFPHQLEPAERIARFGPAAEGVLKPGRGFAVPGIAGGRTRPAPDEVPDGTEGNGGGGGFERYGHDRPLGSGRGV